LLIANANVQSDFPFLRQSRVREIFNIFSGIQAPLNKSINLARKKWKQVVATLFYTCQNTNTTAYLTISTKIALPLNFIQYKNLVLNKINPTPIAIPEKK
jgi:hypothetical protein